MFRTILRLALLLCLPLLRAAEPGAEISGDVLDTSLGAGGDRVYRGNAVFRSGNLLVTADELRYAGATETVVATGRVIFTRGETRLLADRLEYRRTDGWFSAVNIRLGLPPYFAEAASAELRVESGSSRTSLERPAARSASCTRAMDGEAAMRRQPASSRDRRAAAAT